MAVELGTAATQDSSAFATAAQGLEADSAVQSIVAGTGVTVDAADPQNPVVNATGVGGGTVTSVSVAAANGFLATVANPTTTPDITIKTGVTGILYGNGTGVSAAVPANFPTLTSLGAIATIAALRLYSGTAFGQTVFLQGYTAQNDGAQGPFQWGAYTTDDGGTIITPSGQTVGSWYRIFTGSPYVNMWGADPRGVTAIDTPMANAIAYCKANHIGTLRLASGTGYVQNAQITVNAPIKIIAEGWGQDTSSSQASGISNVTITAASTFAATPMFLFKSATSGNVLWNCGFNGCQLVGNFAVAGGATIGVQASSCNSSEFKFSGEGFSVCQLQVDNGNNHITDYNDIDIWYDSTANANCTSSVGLNLYQGVSVTNQGCSLNKIRAFGFVTNTNGILINCGGDNNEFIQVSIGGIHFLNSGNEFGWNNIVYYCSGNIYSDTGTYGNRVYGLDGGSDSSINLTGTAQLHYDVMDNVTSGRFTTPTYLMYDIKTLTPWEFYGNTGTPTVISSPFTGIALADTNIISTTFAAPFNWNNGHLIGINIQWAASAAATGTVNLNIESQSVVPGSTLSHVAPQNSIALSSTAYTANEFVNTKYTFATPIAHTLGNMIMLSISRVTDTYTGTVIIVGVQLIYQCSGPQTGSHTYNYGGMGT